jgi:hypothetical protein
LPDLPVAFHRTVILERRTSSTIVRRLIVTLHVVSVNGTRGYRIAAIGCPLLAVMKNDLNLAFCEFRQALDELRVQNPGLPTINGIADATEFFKIGLEGNF